MKTLCHIIGNWGLWVGPWHSIDPHPHRPPFSQFFSAGWKRKDCIVNAHEIPSFTIHILKGWVLSLWTQVQYQCYHISLKLYTVQWVFLTWKPWSMSIQYRLSTVKVILNFISHPTTCCLLAINIISVGVCCTFTNCQGQVKLQRIILYSIRQMAGNYIRKSLRASRTMDIHET